MSPGVGNVRCCNACGRALESDQIRFCTDMCRVTFQQVFGQQPSLDEEEDLASEEQLLESGFQIWWGDDEDDLEDEEEELDDEKDDEDDEELDDEEFEDEDDLGGELDAEPVTPGDRSGARPSMRGGAGSSKSDATSAAGLVTSRPTPAAGGTTQEVAAVAPVLERVVEMENHVGIYVKRATCQMTIAGDGATARFIVELGRHVLPGPAGPVAQLRLTAVAEDESGDFLAVASRTISTWIAFPPLSIIADLELEVARVPRRLRIYPEAG